MNIFNDFKRKTHTLTELQKKNSPNFMKWKSCNFKNIQSNFSLAKRD